MNELSGVSFASLSEFEKFKFCQRIIDWKLNFTESGTLSYERLREASGCKAIVEQLRESVFIENIFSDEAICNLFKTVLFKCGLDKIEPEGCFREIFETGGMVREFVLGTGKRFVKNHPEVSLETVAEFCVSLGAVFSFESLLGFLEAFVSYPRLADPRALDSMIIQLVDTRNIRRLMVEGIVLPANCFDFYFRTWDCFGIFDSWDGERFGYGSIRPIDFSIGDPRVLKKFGLNDPVENQINDYRARFGFRKSIFEFLKIGVFLQALDDGVEELSIETLCSIYGVEFR